MWMRVMRMALYTPVSMPTTRHASTATITGMPACMILPMTTPASAMTEPMERSMWPATITSVMVQARMPTLAAYSAMFRKFLMVKKCGDLIAKNAISTT